MTQGSSSVAPVDESASSPARSPRCPSCGRVSSGTALSSQPADYEYGVIPQRQFRFWGCAACGTEWLEPRPEIDELIGFYPDGYHAYHDDHGWVARILVSLRARLRSRQYRALLPSGGGRLFDVGAGDCRHFRELSSVEGFHFAGVEINPAMAERARAQGYDVETGTLEGMNLDRHEARYHLVSMNHVLEHVIDPVEVVRRTYRILAPNGRLVGQIPTLGSWERGFFKGVWAGYHFPRHLQIWSRRGLINLLTSNGFTNVRVCSAPHIQSALSVQNWLVQRGLGGQLAYGRSPYFGGLLALSLPIEIVAFIANRSGVIDFEARRPEKEH